MSPPISVASRGSCITWGEEPSISSLKSPSVALQDFPCAEVSARQTPEPPLPVGLWWTTATLFSPAAFPARRCPPVSLSEELWAFAASAPHSPAWTNCPPPFRSIFSRYAKGKGYSEPCMDGNGQLPPASHSEEPSRVPWRPLDVSGTPALEATCTD